MKCRGFSYKENGFVGLSHVCTQETTKALHALEE